MVRHVYYDAARAYITAESDYSIDFNQILLNDKDQHENTLWVAHAKSAIYGCLDVVDESLQSSMHER